MKIDKDVIFGVFIYAAIGILITTCCIRRADELEEKKKKKEEAKRCEYVISEGLKFSIKNDSATFVSIADSTLMHIEVPNSIVYNNITIPVTNVEAESLWGLVNNVDNVLSYKSNVDIPWFLDCKNIENINSAVRTLCPTLNDLYCLKTIRLYGDGFMINEDGEGDCFLQGCSSLEEVVISGAGLVIISDGFNYCANLKRLVFEDVGSILLFDGFKGTTNLNSIIIKGDTTGKSIDIYNIEKEIVYMN
jgi:hypothetical protein